MKRILILFSMVVVVLIAIPILSLSYNYGFHPLYLLFFDVHKGDTLIEVQRKFEVYSKKYGDDEEFLYALRFPDEECDNNRNVAEGCIYIRDGSIFDVVQLTVFFDREGLVIDQIYTGD